MRPTFNDKLTLRKMMAEACEWQAHSNASHIEAAEIAERYEKVLAKIVPKGPVKRRLSRSLAR
mgnify:CR=1 FL=1